MRLKPMLRLGLRAPRVARKKKTHFLVFKANRMPGLIKRTCKGLDDPMTLRTLYCSLVRSNLDYCLVVWSPYTKRNIDKLERVKRRVTKLILKSDDPYDICLKKLNLMSDY